jgi:transcriptional antiterminator RfaH
MTLARHESTCQGGFSSTVRRICHASMELEGASGGVPFGVLMGSHAPPQIPGAAWYVVHTKGREEERAICFLAQRDIPTFLPRVLINHRHGSRRWLALEPLFPGYLFAYFIPDPPLIDRVRWSPGVRKILGNDEALTPVPEDAMRILQERTGTTGYIVPELGFDAGTRVRFRSGPFAYLEGIIERPTSRGDRVRVLLQLLGVQARIEVNVDELERA